MLLSSSRQREMGRCGKHVGSDSSDMLIDTYEEPSMVLHLCCTLFSNQCQGQNIISTHLSILYEEKKISLL
jgi:hypothetical protein